MNKYKLFVKKFVWFYVGANVVIAVALLVFAPTLLAGIVNGTVSVESVVEKIKPTVTTTPTATPSVTVAPTVEPAPTIEVAPQAPAPIVVESAADRVNRIASTVGVTSGIANCSIAGALACYDPSDKSIVVTPYGLTFSDSVLVCALTHEARHSWQDNNGWFKYNADGSLANRAELEADAYTNGCA